jgi:hypothetical protein
MYSGNGVAYCPKRMADETMLQALTTLRVFKQCVLAVSAILLESHISMHRRGGMLSCRISFRK